MVISRRRGHPGTWNGVFEEGEIKHKRKGKKGLIEKKKKKIKYLGGLLNQNERDSIGDREQKRIGWE